MNRKRIRQMNTALLRRLTGRPTAEYFSGQPLLERLEAHYGVKPILYVTYRSYYRYIAGGGYGDYPIWCSSPTVFPLVPGWDFWQYSHSAELEGYYGTQRRIDLNIFRGSRAEFARFG